MQFDNLAAYLIASIVPPPPPPDMLHQSVHPFDRNVPTCYPIATLFLLHGGEGGTSSITLVASSHVAFARLTLLSCPVLVLSGVPRKVHFLIAIKSLLLIAKLCLCHAPFATICAPPRSVTIYALCMFFSYYFLCINPQEKTMQTWAGIERLWSDLVCQIEIENHNLNIKFQLFPSLYEYTYITSHKLEIAFLM